MTPPKFDHEICVRMTDGNRDPCVVGTPDDLAHMDADDGDVVAIYALKAVGKYRIDPRLEAIGRGKK